MGAPDRIAHSPIRPLSHSAAKRLGDLFVESKAFREYRGGNEGPVASLPDFDLKTLFQTSAGWTPETTRTGYVLLSPQERIRVVDLLPKTETVQAAVKYMEETTFTNNAAETAEAGTYPESALATTEQTATVRKIAASLPVTDEQFEDEPRARDYVNNRLEYQLRARLDSQILNGNGTAPNLRGILNVAGINTQAKGTDPAPDAIYKAITLVRKNGFTEPTALVLHPTDWQNLRLLRTADGVYLWGNPTEPGPERAFGLPVVQTTFISAGTAVLGDWAQFAELALRRGIEFQVTNAHSTFFVEGKQMIRADFRCALLWYRPKAFCTVTGL
jgi:HK97 family phage major capsid protein